ncbi:MAG: 1,4-dihydroxy-2-naphthoate polyprenyltransferase [Carnobacterium sp.]|uniref:1,4-dihydroxy-2-naphthoate polyprenyltransferase n=1 Tax=unclassified Carnobacterium TaxID=257487 RepID=UPI001913BCA3|nr:1,4-dihydroxy-2-naphthoate polyprenyltransferase [Carnobacterium sp. CS13]QQP70340.1 1,4-dihydroxy-2-naphthoate polyprenyltransferase [Carnobacterium sp. CS13]
MEDKKELSSAKLMWKMTRPHTLTATFSPVILGTVIAMSESKINGLLFIAMMAACLALQIATNLFNEYYDFKRGLDTADSTGIGGGIVRHSLQPKNVLATAFLLYVLAAFIGVYICMNSSWLLAAIGLLGMAIGYLYTGGPFPIAYTPFGELFSGLSMGIGFVLIAFFIQTQTITLQSLLISIPIGILVGAINLSNNIRDIEEDSKGGRKTLAILLGDQKGIIVLSIAFAVSYVWIVFLVASGYISPWAFIVFLTVKKPFEAIQGFLRGYTEPQYMRIAMKSTALTTTFFGFLLTAGLLISYLF